jgi:hypothetical protein
LGAWQNQSGIISKIGVHFSEIIKVAPARGGGSGKWDGEWGKGSHLFEE